MFAKLNHLAITSDHYTLLGMFYRAVFGLKSSGDTAREIGAMSVGDGYLGMTLIPRRGGRKAGLDHFGSPAPPTHVTVAAPNGLDRSSVNARAHAGAARAGRREAKDAAGFIFGPHRTGAKRRGEAAVAPRRSGSPRPRSG